MRISDWSSDVCSSDLHGRTDLAHEVALMLCLEVADALERAGEPVAGLNVGEHQLVPRLDWNRSRMRSAMMVLSSVSPSSASIKARSASGSEPSGRRSWSTMAWRAASPVGYADRKRTRLNSSH